jgi:hypothetical protein
MSDATRLTARAGRGEAAEAVESHECCQGFGW